MNRIAYYQVFQRASKTAGPIAFEIVVPTGDAEASIAIKGPDQKVRESRITAGPCGKAAVIDDVPVGGPYTVEVSASGLTQSFKNIFVGDLWIISGQSNAVGCGSNAELGRKAMAGVHVLSPKYGQLKWQPASDGMFEQTVGAWVTAAQEFYKETHVPVGMLGHAVGSKPMDYFLDPQTGEVTVLHDLVERHARNAAVFFWYQGESDTFNPDNSRAYGQKLDALARIMRRYTGNAEMMIGTVQLARYMWQHDDSFAEVREAQRQFVLRDAHAVLYSTLPYPINDKDKIHLTTEGYVELGQQIARQMIQREKTGKLNSPGPMLRSVAFAGGDRRRVVVSFDNAAKLTGGDSPDEWYVMDQAHRGFKDGGFVPLAKVTVDAAHAQVLLDLTQSAAGPSVVCYGFRADIGGTLRNDEGNPAVCFAKVAVGEP